MTQIDRRKLLALGAAALTLPPSIAKAWAIDAKSKTGTINDIDHVVILMQENRSFDHYFGTLNGVRGFGDRFPIPLSGGRTVWSQASTKANTPPVITPFPLNTAQTFAHMRVEGTPHNWDNAQYAWDKGRMSKWPDSKGAHAMGHYEEADIPFQHALANAFTICDAYHCSFQGGTNTNRLFLWTGTNDGGGKAGGPSISNSHDTLPEKGGAKEPYTWTTYPERLEKAGVSWKIYEDMADNFGDNPLVGFKAFRDSLAKAPGSNPNLAAKGLSTQHLDVLRADVAANKLPQVSWVVSPAADSEHPGPSSPAQGADYISRVLDCLTSNPDVWARTALLVMYDENDGFFDHVPPPTPPSRDAAGKLLGESTEDASLEYHDATHPTEAKSEKPDLMGGTYGLGPRVPMFVISPFARGGWVNSQVFDHTSVIRFLEARFGVKEPNISAWRRSVCGDLTSCFDFKSPNGDAVPLPATTDTAKRAAALTKRTTPPIPATPAAPFQAAGTRRSRALPYRFEVQEQNVGWLALQFLNSGDAGVVFHAYDHRNLDAPPRRYTVGARKALVGEWPKGPYDVSVYGPNGFYRRYTGSGQGETMHVDAVFRESDRVARLGFSNPGAKADRVTVSTGDYAEYLMERTLDLGPRGARNALEYLEWKLAPSNGWYDFTVRRDGDPAWRTRFAGRIETSAHGYSDPVMGGSAVMKLDG